jgi:hypothetical protein
VWDARWLEVIVCDVVLVDELAVICTACDVVLVDELAVVCTAWEVVEGPLSSDVPG